jgi:hypothetical protein
VEVKDQTDLGKLIDLLRKKGVKSCKFAGVELELLPAEPPSKYKKKAEAVQGEIKTPDIYDFETLLAWSSAGIPMGDS